MRECTQFYINGEWVNPSNPNSFDVINPANEEVCAHISLGNETDLDLAVAAAKAVRDEKARRRVAVILLLASRRCFIGSL